MQVYDLQISGPTDVERINAQGDYIYYSSGSAGGSTPCVEVRGINTGFQVKLMPGQGMRLPMGKVERDWLIKPHASIAGSLIGSLVIGEGEIFDNRVTGSVEVIDGELSRSKSGQAFIVPFNQIGVAGQYSYIEIWNPPQNLKLGVISQFTVSSPQAAGYALQRTNNLITATNAPISKSSTNGTATLKTGMGTSATVAGTLLDVAAQAAGIPITKQFKQPWILEPGSGLILYAGIPNAQFAGSVELIEEAF